PKMFVHAPQGTFTPEARAHVAAELTDLGIACERLADTPQIRAGVWVYFVEHSPDTVFGGGQVATQPIMSLKVYALKGGLDAQSKKRLITDATRILGKYSAPRTERSQLMWWPWRSRKRIGGCTATRCISPPCSRRNDARLRWSGGASARRPSFLRTR